MSYNLRFRDTSERPGRLSRFQVGNERQETRAVLWPTPLPRSRLRWSNPAASYPELRVLRRALCSWVFNKNAGPRTSRRVAEGFGLDHWNSLPVSALAEADVLRRALAALVRKLDGKAAAATPWRKRAALSEVLNTAVEKGYFAENPLNGIRWNAPTVNEEVDPLAVPNPAQAARLLTGPGHQRPAR